MHNVIPDLEMNPNVRRGVDAIMSPAGQLFARALADQGNTVAVVDATALSLMSLAEMQADLQATLSADRVAERATRALQGPTLGVITREGASITPLSL